MLLMGDEVRRTQRGNNNAYCQDNEIELVRLDAARAAPRPPPLREAADRVPHAAATSAVDRRRLTLNELLRRARIDWHGVGSAAPTGATTRTRLAFTIRACAARLRLHVMLNAYWEPLRFELPPAADRAPWRRWIDTSLTSPETSSRGRRC